MNKEAYRVLCQSLKGKKVLGKYIIQDGIGFGSYGIVLSCKEILGGRELAIKMLSIEDSPYLDEANFINEINQMAKLYRCPNILQFILAERHGETFYIVTEYAENGNLRELLREKKQLDVPKAIDIIEQILKGLKAAHDQKIMHRDIKPENILISGDLMKISDFGVAKAVESSSAQMLTHIGTPAYMAPEQFNGKGYGFNADLYPVGIILFEMLTGEKPKTSFRDRMRGKVLEIPREIPKALRAFILKTTRFDSGKRYQNADEMLNAIWQIKEALGLLPAHSFSFSQDFVSFEEAQTKIAGGFRLSLALMLSRRFPKTYYHLSVFIDRLILSYERYFASRAKKTRPDTAPITVSGERKRKWFWAVVIGILVCCIGYGIFYSLSVSPFDEAQLGQDLEVWDFPTQKIRVGNEQNIEVQALPAWKSDVAKPKPDVSGTSPVSAVLDEESLEEEIAPDPLIVNSAASFSDEKTQEQSSANPSSPVSEPPVQEQVENQFVRVAIYSTPQNSEVYIDNQRTSYRTPDQIRLEVGKHYIVTVRKEGYIEETKEIWIRHPNDKTVFHFLLIPRTYTGRER